MLTVESPVDKGDECLTNSLQPRTTKAGCLLSCIQIGVNFRAGSNDFCRGASWFKSGRCGCTMPAGKRNLTRDLQVARRGHHRGVGPMTAVGWLTYDGDANVVSRKVDLQQGESFGFLGFEFRRIRGGDGCRCRRRERRSERPCCANSS